MLTSHQTPLHSYAFDAIEKNKKSFYQYAKNNARFRNQT